MADEDIRSLFDLLKPNSEDNLPVKQLESAVAGLEKSAPMLYYLLMKRAKSAPTSDISYREFQDLLRLSPNPCSLAPVISALFPLLDADDKDCISTADLQRVISTLHLDYPIDTLSRMIEAADRDGDGLVTKADLISFLAPYTAISSGACYCRALWRGDLGGNIACLCIRLDLYGKIASGVERGLAGLGLAAAHTPVFVLLEVLHSCLFG